MRYKFIDLFAGIGGFHLAFHELGAQCVFASEIDKYARTTYKENFYNISPQLFEQGNFNKDILQQDINDIPDFDILCAGFPCQPFSQAGYKKGFSEDKENRGNMFFKICEILEKKQPSAFFLENVRHILNHDQGRTFTVIQQSLDNLGYNLYYKIVKASDYGLPQHRPRIFMIGIKRTSPLQIPFEFPKKTPLLYTVSDIFGGVCEKDIGFTLRVGGRGSKYGDRRNWEFYLVDGSIRRLGVQEGKKMMGYPDDFYFPCSETQAMKQLGNSVAVTAIKQVASNLLAYLSNYSEMNNSVNPQKNTG